MACLLLIEYYRQLCTLDLVTVREDKPRPRQYLTVMGMAINQINADSINAVPIVGKKVRQKEHE